MICSSQRSLHTQRATNTRDESTWPQWDSNPRYQQSSYFIPTRYTARPPGSVFVIIIPTNLMLAYLNEIIFAGHSPLSEAHLTLAHTALQKLVLPSSSSKINKTCSLGSIVRGTFVCYKFPAQWAVCTSCEFWGSRSGVNYIYVSVLLGSDAASPGIWFQISIQSSGLTFKSRKVHEEKGLKVLKPRPLTMRRQGTLETLRTKRTQTQC